MEVKISEADLYHIARLCREIDAGGPTMPGNFMSQGHWDAYVKSLQRWGPIRRERLDDALSQVNELINLRLKGM